MLSLALAVVAAACGTAAPRPTPTPPLAAEAVLQKILNDCWGVSRIQDLDGNRADHVKAFECARPRLLLMGQTYAQAAEPHRVLAWGYLYALKDDQAAEAELERAAQIYARLGQTADQADMLVRIAIQLTMPTDARRGCSLLAQAAGLDPQDASITTYLQNFNCIPRTTPVPVPGTPAPAGTATGP